MYPIIDSLKACTRPVRPAATRAAIALLAAMLVLVPPGGAVCWPLPNGWHIHIGWSDIAGRPTAGLVVYAHQGPGRWVDQHHQGFSALVSPDTVNLSDLRPVTDGALGLFPLLTLAWLCLPRFIHPRQRHPVPLERPPQFLAAV